MSPIISETLKQEESMDSIDTSDSSVVKMPQIVDNNLTISTKLSTDQLICKTPQDSPRSSVRSLNKNDFVPLKDADSEKSCYSVVLYLGVLQILFGLLMSVFGVLVIVHDASLSQIGGGLWGGCLAVATGTAGVLAAARNWCPLRTGAQKIAQTIFLALSLISLAISHLVLVLATTGLTRDVQKGQIIELNNEENASSPDDIIEVLPSNYPALLSNVGLLVVSAIECIFAAMSSYKSARAVCPCFRSSEENLKSNLNISQREQLVSSWLGKHTQPPHIYVVHAPSSIGKHSKLSGGLTPMFAMPQHTMMAPTIYPLIPAPLGSIPSPLIHHHHRNMRNYRRHHKERPVSSQAQTRTKHRPRTKPKERIMTTAEVAKTYTGLDRTIAEEFIQICDSRNTSLCSESSSSCQCGSQSGCTGCTSSDIASRDYLIDKIN